MARKKYSDYEKKLIKNTAENLKRIIKEKRFQQKELSDITGIAQSTISDYVNGRTLILPGNLQKIADALSVNKSDIDSSFSGQEEALKVPIYSGISCGSPNLVAEGILGWEITPKSWLNGGEYFYLRAEGDSMIGARIHDGDLLLIRRQPEVEDGEIAAVVVEDECTMKRVYFRNGSVILQAENPAYPPIVLKKGNVRIVGKLKKVVIKF